MEKIIEKKWLIICGCIVLFFIYLIGICQINFQNDVFFDIEVGEKYIKSGINTLDNFSIHEGLKYVSHHFMVNIITYFTYNLSGFYGIYFLEIILAVILSYLFYRANKMYVKNNIIAYFLTFIEMFFMRGFISQRAQMYSYILFLLEIICIEKFLRTDKKQYLAMLSLIPLLIVNFHAGVLPFYFIIIFVYLLNYYNIKFDRIKNEEKYKKKLKYLVIPIILGIILMFCNPFGIDGVLYSFKTISNEFINANIQEFQASDINNNIMFYIFVLLIFIIYFFSKEDVKTHQVLLILGTSFMTLISLRHFSLLIIVSVTNMGLVEEVIKKIYNNLKTGIPDENQEKFKKALIMILVFVIVYMSINCIIYMNKEFVPENFYPIDGVEYIKNNISSDKRIFNDYSWGSLMMLNDIKVFIDSRCDLYTEEYNSEITVANDYGDVENCNKDYTTILKKYDIDYVFVKKESNLNEFLKFDNRYELIYSDELSVIYEVKI